MQKQKFIYIVNQGIIDSADPFRAAPWLDEIQRFTNLKEALKCYNEIKRITDCVASWSVTDIRKIKIEDINIYDDSGDCEYQVICEFYQPQKYNKKVFTHEKAFESK